MRNIIQPLRHIKEQARTDDGDSLLLDVYRAIDLMHTFFQADLSLTRRT